MRSDFNTPAVLSIINEEMNFSHSLDKNALNSMTGQYVRGLCDLIRDTFAIFGIDLSQVINILGNDVNEIYLFFLKHFFYVSQADRNTKLDEKMLDLVSDFRSAIRQTALAKLKGIGEINPLKLLNLSDDFRRKLNSTCDIEIVVGFEKSYWKKRS